MSTEISEPTEPTEPPKRADYGVIVSRIEQLIHDYGGMSRAELEIYFPNNRSSLGTILSRMHKAAARTPKRIYVMTWVYDAEGGKRYPRAVYGLGDKPDAKKPVAQRKLNARRYRQNTGARVNSIWAMAAAFAPRKSKSRPRSDFDLIRMGSPDFDKETA